MHGSGIVQTSSSTRPVASSKKPAVPVLAKRLMAVIMLGGLGVVQFLLVVKPTVGLYVLVLLLMVIAGLALRVDALRNLALSVMIIPVASLVVMAFPARSSLVRIAVYYAVLFILGLAYRLIFARQYHFKRYKITPTDFVKLLVPVATVSVLIGGLHYLAEGKQFGLGSSLLVVLALSVLFAAAEEIFFRGLIHEQASKVFSADATIVFVSLVYALLVTGASSYFTQLIAFAACFILSTLYAYRPNLVLSFTSNVIMKAAFVVLVWLF